MKLNELRDNPGATKNRKRVGRGIGSGTGKTSGHGVKGQKARSGVAINGFEGGQMPLHMRIPKRGFNKPNRLAFNEINLNRLQRAVEAGKIKEGDTVTVASLVEAGILRRPKDGLRLLGTGELSAKLSFEVSGASKSAIEKVEKAGGSVTIVEQKPKKADTADKDA